MIYEPNFNQMRKTVIKPRPLKFEVGNTVPVQKHC